MEKENTSYEIGYLLKTNLKDAEAAAFCATLRNLVVENSGFILSDGVLKDQILAYPIKKEVNALFGWFKFVIKSSSLKELKNYLEKQPAVLRFLIIKFKEDSAKKSVSKPKIGKERFVKKIPKKAEQTCAEPARLLAPPKDIAEPEEKKEPALGEDEIDKKIEELLSNN